VSRLLPVVGEAVGAGPVLSEVGLGGPALACRPACGACCIAPSIATMPGMLGGKPANVPCIHLRPDDRCALFGLPERPACCGGLQPSHEMCGDSRDEALRWLAALEVSTRPK
jgi:hypothetical protein